MVDGLPESGGPCADRAPTFCAVQGRSRLGVVMSAQCRSSRCRKHALRVSPSLKKWAGREARPVSGSILTGKHDRQHANCLRGVARVFASHVAPGAEAGAVVIVDLP
jgi:hypothetical protein